MTTSTKTIKITNDENFNINLYFKAEKASGTSGNDVLAEALTVKVNTESNHLSYLFNNNITLGIINSGDSQDYDITIIFDAYAGNQYQDKNIDFNFVLTVEEEHVIIPGGRGGGGGGGSRGTAAYCGDGKIDTFKFEECDDGNNIDGDGCSSTCIIELPEGEVKGESTEAEEEKKENKSDGEAGETFLPKGKVAGEETGIGEEIGDKETQKELEIVGESQEKEEKGFLQNLLAGVGLLFSGKSLNIILIILIIIFISLILSAIRKRRENKRR